MVSFNARWKIIFIAVLATSVSWEAPAFSQEADPYTLLEQERPKGRTWNEHTFIPSLLVRSPFIDTTFSSAIAYGVSRADAPRFNDAGEIDGTKTYTLAALEQSFEFGLRLYNWWSLRAGGDVSLFLPGSTDAALGLGGAAQADGSVGMTLSVPLTRWLRIGATGDLEWALTSRVNILAALQQSIEQRSFQDVDLLTNNDGPTAIGGISAALALTDWLGIIGRVEYVHTFDPTLANLEDQNLIGFGGAVDLDLRQLVLLNFGINAAYFGRLSLEDAGETQHSIDLGAFYIESDELVLGPELAVHWFDIRPLSVDGGEEEVPTVDSVAFVAQIVFQYYW